MAFAFVSILTSGCCSEYQQTPGDGCERDTGGQDSTPSDPVELCDGLDNDGDGYADEGLPDQDGDWVADCLDDACAVEASPAEPVAGDHACGASLVPPTDPWNIEVLWEVWAEPDEWGCRGGTVAVDVDQDGVSDVVCAGAQTASAYSGVDGSVIWTSAVLMGGSPFAAADTDLDGALELYAISERGHALRLALDGTLAWESASAVIPSPQPSHWDTVFYYHFIEVADLLGDGSPAITGNHRGWSAEDGSPRLQFDGEIPGEDVFPTITPGDFDGSGVQQIADGWAVYGPSGQRHWQAQVDPQEIEPGAFPTMIPVQADMDDQAEMVLLTNHWAGVYDSDGSSLHHLGFSEMTWSVGCAGDVDGDGVMEIPVSGRTQLQLLELDGTVAWTHPLADETQGVGCTTFDFDLDGAAEIVIGDEEDFYILDGRTGAVLFHNPDRAGDTQFENPLVVDLDGDGSVEIVEVVAGAEYIGDATIRVYGNVNRDWPPGGRIWPSATWSGTSLFPDGSVPRTPEAPWLTTLRWRGQPEVLLGGLDLRPEVVGSCVSSCDPAVGKVLLDLRLVNPGPQEIQRCSSIAAYAQAEDGSRTPVGVLDFPDFVDNGWASASQSLSLSLDQAMAGLVLVAGDDGSGGLDPLECAPDDNEITWRLDACD